MTPQRSLNLILTVNGSADFFLLETDFSTLKAWIEANGPSSFFDNTTNLSAYLRANSKLVAYSQGNLVNESRTFSYVPTRVTAITLVFSDPSTNVSNVSFQVSLRVQVAPADKVRTLGIWLLSIGALITLPWVIAHSSENRNGVSNSSSGSGDLESASKPVRHKKPFVEVLSLSLKEDYRFPLLEVFAFLYSLSTFTFASFQGNVTISSIDQTLSQPPTITSQMAAYTATSSLLGLPLVVLVLLVLKNAAYGLGNDLERGIIQTIFSYPLGRFRILLTKLISALLIPLTMFIVVQIAALYLLAPDIVSSSLSTVLLTFAANLSEPILVAVIVLLATLLLRRGGISLITGVVLFFALQILANFATFVAAATNSPLILQALSVINPGVALSWHFIGSGGTSARFNQLWNPSISDVLNYVLFGYLNIFAVLLVGILYFTKRFNL